jgi:hypothetical protein
MDASVLIATMGFAGMVVGSALTYLIQWLMVKRQRLWVIEDSKVQHQRAIENEMRQRRYERLRQKVNVISSQVGLKITFLTQAENYELELSRTVTKEQRTEVLKQIETQEGEVQSALMATGSEELLKLHQALNSHFYSAIGYPYPNELNKAWEAAQAVHKKMEALLDEALVK